MSEKLTWGMIGAGDVTELKNGPGLYLNPNCELKAITNRTYERAVDWASRHNNCVVYKTVEELLADPDIQIVYIATTPDVHKQQAIQCANAGKHVYIEKPLFMSYQDAQDVLDTCAANGVRAYVAHYRRGLPQFEKAKELIESGVIGTPVTAQIVFSCPRDTVHGWRADAAVAGGGHFFEADIHVLDAVDFILGPYKSFHLTVSPQSDDPSLEGAVSAVFEYENGMIGSGMWNYNSAAPVDYIQIFGTEGSVKLGGLDFGKPIELVVDDEMQLIDLEVPKHVGAKHEMMIAEDILSGGNNQDLCTLENGMRTFKVACTAMDLLRG